MREPLGHGADGGRVERRGGGGVRGRAGGAGCRGRCLGPLHHGSDGGGSIRVPAAFCGGVGLKPTGRRVPRRRWGAGIAQFEADGALARTVEDAALMVAAMRGGDARGPGRRPRGVLPGAGATAAAGGLRGLTVSAPPSLAADEVRAGVAKAVDALRRAGAAVTDEMPDMPEPSEALGIVSAAGAVVEYGRLAEAHESRLTDYVRRSLARGRGLTGADVASAYADIDRVVRAMEGLFEGHDALVLPTTATTAPENLARVPQGAGGAVNPWLISTLHVSLANLIQAPAVAIPTGLDRQRMPTSVQIVARPGDEATLLRCAVVVEEAVSGVGRPPLA
ncbi:MAG: amidase [Alphaproteobacteria bacterium]|nr:amidase [Alphaproteobacteria bacterium]